MSRFYDALRQASRFHQSAEKVGPQESLAAFGIETLTVGPVEQEPAALQGEASSALASAPSRPDPWVISAGDSQAKAETAHPAVAHTNVDIDRKAPVIPNIADHLIVEHYRRLRTKLIQHHSVKPFRSLLITSPSPREGKTVTTLNLALSFSMLPSFKVAVVDGDLRRGSLGQWLGLNQRPGLSNLIEGTASLDEVIFRCNEAPVHFIPRGTSSLAAAELLHSPALGAQFRRMTEHFDLVVVDSPPVDIITDAQLLASNCDAVLLVARAFSTTCKSFEKAVQDLSPFHIVGTVLNGGTRKRLYKSYNGYY